MHAVYDNVYSFRRPRGIEQNYFVELFLEADESMKVPSIGGLLAKMFFEQQISFTEVSTHITAISNYSMPACPNLFSTKIRFLLSYLSKFQKGMPAC